MIESHFWEGSWSEPKRVRRGESRRPIYSECMVVLGGFKCGKPREDHKFAHQARWKAA